MAAVAIAGIGMMMVSSLAAVMLMGGEEETPTTTTSDQSAAGPTGDEDDDTGDDDSGATTPTPAPAVDYHWTVNTFKKIERGEPFKTINNASVNNCRNKCENKNKCVGFSIGPLTGTKRCILYSGDVSTVNSLNVNTHLLSRV